MRQLAPRTRFPCAKQSLSWMPMRFSPRNLLRLLISTGWRKRTLA